MCKLRCSQPCRKVPHDSEGTNAHQEVCGLGATSTPGRPAWIPLERSTATCGPRGRGQPFDTETLPGVDTAGGWGEDSGDPECLQRQEPRKDATPGPGSPSPAPAPRGPGRAGYITPPGVPPRRVSWAGGADGPRGPGAAPPPPGRGPESGRDSGPRLRRARAGPPGFRFPAPALTPPQKPAHRHHNKGGDAAATPGWEHRGSAAGLATGPLARRRARPPVPAGAARGRAAGGRRGAL